MRMLKSTAAVVSLLLAVAAGSQEGFPLEGTWRGEWGPDGGKSTVVIVMKWDGENVNDMIRRSTDRDRCEARRQPGGRGYWGQPNVSSLFETGMQVAMDEDGAAREHRRCAARGAVSDGPSAEGFCTTAVHATLDAVREPAMIYGIQRLKAASSCIERSAPRPQ
jgi:hypothetical protein